MTQPNEQNQEQGPDIYRFLHHSLGGYFVTVKKNFLPSDYILYSAHQSLQQKLEKAEAENKRLRNALEYYASLGNWNEGKDLENDCIDNDDVEFFEYWVEGVDCGDYVGGKRARQALKGEGE